MVLSVPPVDPKRYYSVQLIDGNTFNYGYIGSRATGSDAGDYMVVGPEWKGATPAGVKKVFRSTTQFSFVLYRTQLFDPGDIDNVMKVQAGYKAQPLSAYLKQPAPPASPAVNFPEDRQGTREDELLRVSRFLLAVRAGAREREGYPGEACAHRCRARKDLQLQGSPA